MFTIDTVVDQSVKTAKQFTAYVKEENVRKELDSLVDAQAAYTKTVFKSAVDMGKYAAEQFGKFDPKAFDVTNLFGQVKK